VAIQLRDGSSVEEVAGAFECSAKTVRRVREEWAFRRRSAGRSELRLCFAERERISRGLACRQSARAIARDLGRSPSTITREIDRCGGRRNYRALAAERAMIERSRRPKPTKLSGCPQLVEAVEQGLRQRWSPQQISARLKAENPGNQEMQISHETIYQSLYVQSRGELRRQLARNLRSGRAKRRPRKGGPELRGKIAGMVMISERPAEAEDRAVPGHWEGDLITGKANRSFISTLVERQTRFVMLVKVPDAKSVNVTEALAAQITELPARIARTLTWDQGKEMNLHQRFTEATGIEVYFCDPHSPWQRGSNENTNGLLRQYLPKGSDLSLHSQADLDGIADELNGRPRETLSWRTPAEKMEELLR